MSNAGPSQVPPTVQGRSPLERQSLRRFSFLRSLKILVSEMDLSLSTPGEVTSEPGQGRSEEHTAAAQSRRMMRMRFMVASKRSP